MQVILIKQWIIKLLKTLYFCTSSLEINHWNVHCLTTVVMGGFLVPQHYTDIIMGAMGAISDHQPHHCSLNRLFRHRSKKTSKLHVTGLCAGNSPVTGEFPAQSASNAWNVSIWWHHLMSSWLLKPTAILNVCHVLLILQLWSPISEITYRSHGTGG